jgi:subtilase family protein
MTGRMLVVLGVLLGLGANAARVARAEPHGVIVGPGGALRAEGRLPLAAETPSGPRVAPGRIVVKYRESLDACVPCLVAARGSFAAATGSDSLDRLHGRLGLRAARALFSARPGRAQARAALRARLQAARRRFPLRAARAPAGTADPDLSGIYVLELSPDVDPVEAARAYAADPAVAWATPDVVVDVGFTPNDPYLSTSGSWGQPYADLWGLTAVDARTAWDTTTGQGTVIAVVDTGVDDTHPDLAANIWTNAGEIPANGVDDDGNGYVDDVHGWDFVDGDDRYGHGTHVAGIAAAVGNDAIGVAGVAFGARVMPLKGITDGGFGYISDLAEAILYAAENGADVINNS